VQRLVEEPLHALGFIPRWLAIRVPHDAGVHGQVSGQGCDIQRNPAGFDAGEVVGHRRPRPRHARIGIDNVDRVAHSANCCRAFERRNAQTAVADDLGSHPLVHFAQAPTVAQQ
jgi:hypothetical protein